MKLPRKLRKAMERQKLLKASEKFVMHEGHLMSHRKKERLLRNQAYDQRISEKRKTGGR